MTAIVHVVLVKWRDDVPPEAREEIARDARAMADTIPGILALEEGPSVSPEGHEQGFEWALVVTFDGPESRDGYLPHPVHRAVGERIGGGAEKLVVFDVAADRTA